MIFTGKHSGLAMPVKSAIRLSLLICLSAGLAACDQAPDADNDEATSPAPTGQVVARINGQEITIHELSAEIARIRLGDGADRAKMERQVLLALAERTILVQLAEKDKLDRRPDVWQDIRRSRSAILAKAYASARMSDRPLISRSAAEAFVFDNPSYYANREYFVFDAIAAKTADLPEDLKDELSEFGDLDRVESRLRELGLEHRREPQTAFSDQLAKVMLDQMDELESSGRIFYMVSGAGTLISKLQIRRPAGRVGEVAIRSATKLLERKASETAFREMRQDVITFADTEFVGRFSDLDFAMIEENNSELAEQIDAAVNGTNADEQLIEIQPTPVEQSEEQTSEPGSDG